MWMPPKQKKIMFFIREIDEGNLFLFQNIGPQLSLIMELSKHKQSLICSEIVSSISQSLKLRMDLHKKRTNKQSTLKDLMVCIKSNYITVTCMYNRYR